MSSPTRQHGCGCFRSMSVSVRTILVFLACIYAVFVCITNTVVLPSLSSSRIQHDVTPPLRQRVVWSVFSTVCTLQLVDTSRV